MALDPAFEVQLQIRQNAQEMQDAFADLHKWCGEISRKDKEISAKSGAIKSSTDSAPPGVRGRVGGVVPDAPVELQSVAEPLRGPVAVNGRGKRRVRRRKIGSSSQSGQTGTNSADTGAKHTYTYYRERWDKFDVDAALAEADEESEYEWVTEEEDEAPAKLRSDSAGSGATGGADLTPRASRPVNAAQQPASNDGMPAIRGQPTTADGWRVRGNDLFRAGQLEDAAVCYTRSIDVEPTALAYGNRAMARLRMRQWREAAEDAAAAVALDPLYVKGHQRSAVAKAELGDLLGAAQDYDAALRLEPTSRALSQDRLTALAKLLAHEGLERPATRTRVPVTLPVTQAAAARPPAAQPPAAAPRERSEGEGSPRAGAEGPDAAAEPGSHAVARQRVGTTASPRDGPEAEGAPAARGSEALEAREKPAGRGGGEGGAQEGALPSPSPGPDARAGGGPTRVPGDLASPDAGASRSPAGASSPKGPGAWKAPSTGAELEMMWRSALSEEDRVAILARLPPARLPAILKNSLTPGLLLDVMECGAGALRRARGEVVAAALLEGLSKVPRLSIVSMLMGQKGRARAGEALSQWAAESEDAEMVASVRKALQL